jgi:hypothetical protein
VDEQTGVVFVGTQRIAKGYARGDGAVEIASG